MTEDPRGESAPRDPTTRDDATEGWRASAPSRARAVIAEVRSTGTDLGGHLVAHSLLVGLVVGVAACLFFVLIHAAEELLVGGLAGYRSLRPNGEFELPYLESAPHALSLVVLAFLPALGGLVSGLISSRLAPEIEGGGGDAYIDAFHDAGTPMRRRVAYYKMIATAAILGTGGSAGREGPTMQVGASIAAAVGRLVPITARERRLLLVAGTAAGLAAMFGTPLGAALLATEVLYEHDFESEALIPALLASVVAYSVFLKVFPGSGHLFAHAPRYPFRPAHLPYYALLAIVLAIGGRLFVAILSLARRLFLAVRSRVLRPALGGLALGLLAVGWLAFGNPRLGLSGIDVGALGSGAGVAQEAILSASLLPEGWAGVAFFGGFAVFKMITTSLTLGSGGSGGDFGPSLAIGALLGGAFGRAVSLLVGGDLDPGAFALVAMGAFYGGLANTPVSALVLVCEMTGTYDLLVPAMLTNVLGFVLMRRANLYHTQLPSRSRGAVSGTESELGPRR